MEVTYINHMGSDLSVVNSARVSFHKESDWEYNHGGITTLKNADERLINYLAKHKHWSPFAHTSVTFRIKAPIFVARQLGKHQVGLVWNEVSRRYVDTEPEFYDPEIWRERADNVKQGSSIHGIPLQGRMKDRYSAFTREVLKLYNSMLEQMVCPEQARMVLPQSMYTEWYWTGSMVAFERVCKLRLDPHTQAETRYIAEQIDKEMRELFPVSWRALMQ